MFTQGKATLMYANRSGCRKFGKGGSCQSPIFTTLKLKRTCYAKKLCKINCNNFMCLNIWNLQCYGAIVVLKCRFRSRH